MNKKCDLPMNFDQVCAWYRWKSYLSGKKFIANTVLINGAIYDRSCMASILDMQIT